MKPKKAADDAHPARKKHVRRDRRQRAKRGPWTGGPPFEENLYTEQMLREAFADHDILSLREHDAHVAEGSGHYGMSALIDCVVRTR